MQSLNLVQLKCGRKFSRRQYCYAIVSINKFQLNEKGAKVENEGVIKSKGCIVKAT